MNTGMMIVMMMMFGCFILCIVISGIVGLGYTKCWFVEQGFAPDTCPAGGGLLQPTPPITTTAGGENTGSTQTSAEKALQLAQTVKEVADKMKANTQQSLGDSATTSSWFLKKQKVTLKHPSGYYITCDSNNNIKLSNTPSMWSVINHPNMNDDDIVGLALACKNGVIGYMGLHDSDGCKDGGRVKVSGTAYDTMLLDKIPRTAWKFVSIGNSKNILQYMYTKCSVPLYLRTLTTESYLTSDKSLATAFYGIA